MGLIMLILIGIVPTAYALNRAIPASQTADFVAVSQQAVHVMDNYVDKTTTIADPRDQIQEYVRNRTFTANTTLALRQIISDISNELQAYGDLSKVSPTMMRNFRNDMYLVSESLRLMQKSGKPALTESDWSVLANYKSHIDKATKFIPTWVKSPLLWLLDWGRWSDGSESW
jgi:inorganic phosphate transporter, PiT family